jgi:CheY-like chemotaxis protein
VTTLNLDGMIQKRKTILYIDDDEDDREILVDALHNVDPGVEVIFAGNGLEALQYLRGKKDDLLPGLIVLDINMPYLDGKETFEHIKSDPQLTDIPLVVFTSSENPNDKALFNKKGVEMITKPDNVLYMNEIASHMLCNCS